VTSIPKVKMRPGTTKNAALCARIHRSHRSYQAVTPRLTGLDSTGVSRSRVIRRIAIQLSPSARPPAMTG
jgi:hypothetical protein